MIVSRLSIDKNSLQRFSSKRKCHFFYLYLFPRSRLSSRIVSSRLRSTRERASFRKTLKNFSSWCRLEPGCLERPEACEADSRFFGLESSSISSSEIRCSSLSRRTRVAPASTSSAWGCRRAARRRCVGCKQTSRWTSLRKIAPSVGPLKMKGFTLKLKCRSTRWNWMLIKSIKASMKAAHSRLSSSKSPNYFFPFFVCHKAWKVYFW